MVPRQYRSGSTCHLRFQTWVRAGVFKRIWRVCLNHYDDLQGIDWRFQSLDSATVSAPVKGGSNRERPYESRQTGHQAARAHGANGIPLAVTLSGANRHDMKMFGATLDAVVVPRPSPKKKPRQHLCNDKGYDYPELRRSAARRGYIAHIKSRGQEEKERKKNPRYKARRWVVERSNRWHNLFRRLKIRYEVHAENYLAFVQFASAIICWRSAAA